MGWHGSSCSTSSCDNRWLWRRLWLWMWMQDLHHLHTASSSVHHLRDSSTCVHHLHTASSSVHHLHNTYLRRMWMWWRMRMPMIGESVYRCHVGSGDLVIGNFGGFH